MARCSGLVWHLILVVAFLDIATAEDHELIWKVPSSEDIYANWTTKEFEIGDVVTFSWTTETHNVANVSKADYDSCTKTSPLLGSSSPLKFTFNSIGTHYFICTVGQHCTLGQKVTLITKDKASNPTAQPPTVVPPPPAPVNSAKSLDTAGLSATFLAIVVGLLL